MVEAREQKGSHWLTLSLTPTDWKLCTGSDDTSKQDMLWGQDMAKCNSKEANVPRFQFLKGKGLPALSHPCAGFQVSQRQRKLVLVRAGQYRGWESV